MRRWNWPSGPSGGVKKIRLIGVSVSGFEESDRIQLGLFSDEKPQDIELERLRPAVDSLKDRYGESIVVKGAALQAKERVTGKK